MLQLSWESLRRLGESRVAKISVLAPFIGHFVLYNGAVLEYISVADNWDFFANRFGVTRLHLTYFGLFVFGVASVLFQLTCPMVNRRYESLEQFVTSELPLCTGTVLIAVYDRLNGKYGERFRRQLEDAIGDAGDGTSNPLSPNNLHSTLDRHKLDLLRLEYTLENEAGATTRHAVTILYLVGFALLALPGLLIFAEVTASLLPALMPS